MENTVNESIEVGKKLNKTASKKKASRYFDANASDKTKVFDYTERKIRYKAHSHHDQNRKYSRGNKLPGHKKNKLSQDKSSNYKKMLKRKKDPFPGPAPVDRGAVKKYKRGEKMQTNKFRKGTHKGSFTIGEEKFSFAGKQSARAEFLLQEEEGYIEPEEEGEDTTKLSQYDIKNAVDITSAEKSFELNMNDFGPYSINYTRNGRFLLMGGAKGHVAAIDWMTKKLRCEMNVMESVHDVRWLHQETMFAVAQKQCVYIYDNKGIELHCLRTLDRVVKMDFLPFHFLLVSGNVTGYLCWLDITMGKKVAGHKTGYNNLNVMCQNPKNAITCLGHNQGTVTMWTPNTPKPVVKMLCHKSGVRSVAIDNSGQYLATSGIDRRLRIWDLRTYKPLQSYDIGMGAGQLQFSQKGLLAVGKGSIVEVYKDCCRQTVQSPYLCHRPPSTVKSLQFCPFEDVLGVGHTTGFQSLLIPGAGEPNFDTLEANPYQTVNQRKEAEVKMLLDKIPAEFIQLDDKVIQRMSKNSPADQLSKKPKKSDENVTPRYKMKGGSKGSKKEQRKKGMKETSKRTEIKQALQEKRKENKKSQQKKKRNSQSSNVLDRFQKNND